MRPVSKFAFLCALQSHLFVVKCLVTSSATSGNNGSSEMTLITGRVIDKTVPVNWESLRNIQNQECERDLASTVTAFKNNALWAERVFDSFAKVPAGLLYDNFYHLGNFDECLSTNYQENNGTSIRGQYCLSKVYVKRNINEYSHQMAHRKTFNNNIIHLGICIPSSCSSKDGEVIVKEYFSDIFLNSTEIYVEINEKSCDYEQQDRTSTGEIIYGVIIAWFLLFIIFSTLLHIIHIRKRIRKVVYNVDTIRSQNKGFKNDVVMSFSLIQTVGKLLHSQPNEHNLECISGIKFLSMLLIIAGHSLIFVFGGAIANVDFFQKVSVEVSSGIFLNSPLLVDSFLLISGFLMCYLLLTELDKRSGGVNVVIMYIARYIRLTPAYLVVIGLYMTWLPKLGSGPQWKKTVVVEHERCLNSWWTNLLYINNYVRTDSLCMFQAWYLAADYHLFIVAPVIIFPLWRSNKLGLSLLGLVIAGTAAIPFIVTLKEHLDPTLLAFPWETEDLGTNHYFLQAYIKTHMRAASYFIGILFGYAVHNIQNKAVKIPATVRWSGWILTGVFGPISMFSIVIFYQPNIVLSDLQNSLYAGFHRIVWSCAVGWVITLCVTDNAAIINKFLSWKLFVPLSRLTYCAYLVNGLIELYHRGINREALFLSKFDLACRLLGHLLLTFFLAFWLCVCFESPIHGLEKILLRKKSSNEKIQAPSTTVTTNQEI